jgi:hypothetical protein
VPLVIQGGIVNPNKSAIVGAGCEGQLTQFLGIQGPWWVHRKARVTDRPNCRVFIETNHAILHTVTFKYILTIIIIVNSQNAPDRLSQVG